MDRAGHRPARPPARARGARHGRGRTALDWRRRLAEAQAPRATRCAPPTRTPRRESERLRARGRPRRGAGAARRGRARAGAMQRELDQVRARRAERRGPRARAPLERRAARRGRRRDQASAPSPWPTRRDEPCARASTRSPPGSTRRSPRSPATASPSRRRRAGRGCARATTPRWRASGASGAAQVDEGRCDGCRIALSPARPRPLARRARGRVHGLSRVRATPAAVIILIRHGQSTTNARGCWWVAPTRRSPRTGERQARRPAPTCSRASPRCGRRRSSARATPRRWPCPTSRPGASRILHRGRLRGARRPAAAAR